jgi:copper chaperone CopZ
MKMNTAKLKVEGMHCDGCAQIIQSFLEKKTGVAAANVSFNDGEARVFYDTHAIAEDQLVEAIEKAGYRIVSKS